MIQLMGDKATAKDTMRKAGVPVVPGSDGLLSSMEEGIKLSKGIKYPVIIKAAAGGGGRGMRVCHNEVRLVSALMTAQHEAEKGGREVKAAAMDRRRRNRADVATLRAECRPHRSAVD